MCRSLSKKQFLLKYIRVKRILLCWLDMEEMESFFSEEKALHLLLAGCHSVDPQLSCNLSFSCEKNMQLTTHCKHLFVSNSSFFF